MATPLPVDLVVRLQALSPAEKLQLIGDLWDDLSGDPENIPVLDWQTRELRRRADSPAIEFDEFVSRMRQRGTQ